MKVLWILLVLMFGCATQYHHQGEPTSTVEHEPTEMVKKKYRVKRTTNCTPNSSGRPSAEIGLEKELGSKGKPKLYNRLDCTEEGYE